MEHHSAAFFNQSNNLSPFIVPWCSLDIRLYAAGCRAKTEQKILAPIDSIVASLLKNRAKFPDRTAPAFGLCVGKDQKHNLRYADANHRFNGPVASCPLCPPMRIQIGHRAMAVMGPISDIKMHAFGSNCRRRPTNVRSSIALRDLTDGQQGRRHTSGVGRPSNRTSLVEWLLVVPAQDRFEPDERACCPSRDRPAASSASRRDRQGATCGSTIRRSHVLRLATNGR
jgi:hypothetical protein